MTRQKSLKLNMMLNAIKGIMSIIFPLITFPYVSRVLGVINIGRYNFANSVISYFILIAGLGIGTYAIREGSRFRNNKSRFKVFADEMFSINIVSTIISYAIFFALLISVAKFHDYRDILLILSLQVAFKTIGVEWIYSIYEDYAYITIVSIMFQAISLVLMFSFVKNENDVYIYAFITVVSSVGSNLLYYIHAKKYCKINIVKEIDWHKHIKPILVMFAMAVTVTIYVSSDVTILGIICGDYTVGIYSVSVKVYSIIKTVLSSVLTVSIPRLSFMLGVDDNERFRETASDIYSTLLTVVLPAITGIIVLRKHIVLLLANESYIAATSSLTLLMLALFFCMGSWFWGQCILVPVKKEGTVVKVTVASAVVNIVLNFILIPIWKENAAALTTIIAEAMAFIWCWYNGQKYANIKGSVSTLVKVLLGCVGILIVSIVCNILFGTGVTYMISTVVGAVIVYGVIEVALRNEAVWSILNGLKKKLRK